MGTGSFLGNEKHWILPLSLEDLQTAWFYMWLIVDAVLQHACIRLHLHDET